MTRILTVFAALAAFVTLSLGAVAEEHPAGMHVMDPYARAGGMGKSGAVFMTLHNNIDQDDRLIDARSEIAAKVELHTHKDMGDGVMKMMHVPEGFAIGAGEMHELARGGDHVMLMGLKADLKNADTFPLTLVFEKAGEITIDVPVDNDRKPEEAEGMGHNHSGHNHGG